MKIKQVVFTGHGKVEVKATEASTPLGATQVLVETVYSMVSPGTELAMLWERHTKSARPDRPDWLRFPSIPGYLACGKVMEVGAQVKNVRPGDRVACEGPGVWNSHQSHLVMSGDDPKLVPLPAGVSDEEAVFIKMGSIAMTGPRVLSIELGDSVVVMGLGLVGQVAAQLCRLAGAGRVIGVDPAEKRRRIAQKLHIECVAPDDPSLKTVTPGDRLNGVDHIVDASGHPSSFLKACEIARVRGKIAVLGVPHRTFEVGLYEHVHCKGIQVLGAHGFILPQTPDVTGRWTDGAQRRLFAQFLDEKRVDVRPLITHKVRVEEAPEMYKGLSERPEEYLGVLFDWRKVAGGK